MPERTKTPTQSSNSVQTEPFTSIASPIPMVIINIRVNFPCHCYTPVQALQPCTEKYNNCVYREYLNTCVALVIQLPNPLKPIYK